MARTVVGLFENQRDAQAARRDLQTAGFGGDRVALVTGAAGQLVEMLARSGVPRDDAAIYGEGVQAGGALIVAQALPHADAQQVASILDRHNVVDIGARGRMARQTADFRATSGRTSLSNDYQGGDMVIPIVEENIRVGKREVEAGGVRVQTHVEERPVNQQVTVRDETVEVERVPVDRPVDTSTLRNPDEAFIPVSVEVREQDEQVVVDKQARVVEEVVINKDVEERVETVEDTVRRTDVDVEQLPGTMRTAAQTTTARSAGSTTSEGIVERAVGTDSDISRRDPRAGQ